MADITKLTEGTVTDAEKALPDLSDAELSELHDAEKAGKNRTTLLDAIHGEQKDRSSGDDSTESASETDDKPDDGRKARLATMVP